VISTIAAWFSPSGSDATVRISKGALRSPGSTPSGCPFPDGAFDTVVATLLFCSVECPPCGLDEIARVLAPGGRYLFLEHVRPEHPRLARFFDSINPLWNGVSRGCNLNRDTIREMEIAGFTLARKRQDRNGVFVWGEARHDPER
jgi:SAM-dependent methyltransferase